ncbi:hypothetical protein DY023_17095 [Microbacterium bovistercoris]|uniref:PH domain-containing protein n=1 Tax=Microbacterium bovistercoris TaxID=2293570 RepID=A0A371NQM1_9MICO|nr:hypothetical protein [Microbacterium bovistercoris]REJ04027.1 hypothetical protein DY023_17095 [Microbacterium bovistercoris]
MTVTAHTPSRSVRAGSLLRRAMHVEKRVYTSIGRALLRRPAVPTGGTGIAYHRPVLTVLIIFIVLSAIEIPVIDLIVHRWVPVRIGFLILGIWGLTWMVGLLCAMLMRPHSIGPDGIRVRNGLEIDVPFSWDDIASIAIVTRVDQPKTPRVVDGVYSERMQYETNIQVELERPVTVSLPGMPPHGGIHEVTTVRSGRMTRRHASPQRAPSSPGLSSRRCVRP